MTYKSFKNLSKGLLLGDNVLPPEDVIKELLKYALETVATQADSLHLLTLDTYADILRVGVDGYYIRRPLPPTADEDVIDIDEELVSAVARFFCSYVSKDKGGIHILAADRIIKDFNAKTYELKDKVANDLIDGGTYDFN